jgi:glycosyl-4,4'-diaponeurosporenoate acyltransferase
MHKKIQGHGVVHHVASERAAIARLEGVLVKDRLPDAARWFDGGFAKGSLAAHDPAYLRRFIRETWRGELCHWFALGCVPVFFLWNPWWADMVMVGYAMMANIPCILAQRYNRLRLRRLLARQF